MRDWNTPPPSGGFPAPAEGLPPCWLGRATLENRTATLHAVDRCSFLSSLPPRVGNFRVSVGYVANSKDDHPFASWVKRVAPLLDTDDPAEAEAAFERGAEWVRTGEGP